MNGLNIDNKFELFQSHLTNCIETHVPLRKLTVREKKFRSKPWISEGLQNNIAYRDQLAREIHTENKSHLKSFYNKFRKRLEKKLFRAKQDFFKGKIDAAKTNSRNIWSIINDITGRKKSKSPYPKKIRLNNGTLSENPEKIANTLNDYFVNIGPDLASKLEPSRNPYDSYMPSRNRNSFFCLPLTLSKSWMS